MLFICISPPPPEMKRESQKNAQSEHPIKIDKQENKAEILFAECVCVASNAPKTPAHQTMVMEHEISRT